MSAQSQMKAAPPTPPSGAAMDVVVKRDHRKRNVLFAAAAATVVAGGAAIWHFSPHGLSVSENDLRIVTVGRDLFLDDIVVRAVARPQHSVILDAVESGRVEEVVARDGALVNKGDLLFRLSNPERTLQLLARQSDRAQQISNLSNLQANFESSRAEDQRRITQQQHELTKAQRRYESSAKLAQQGFISDQALQDARDEVALQKRLLDEATRATEVETRTRVDGMAQMQRAMQTIDSGLKVVNEAVDALAVRAPVAGRLTDFNLQVGQTIKTGGNTGRIDDPSSFKLVVEVDEFYLARVSLGLAAKLQLGDRGYDLTVSRIYPQIKDGRFTVDLAFSGKTPDGIHPGQSLDARINLGQSSPALLLPNAAFVGDSGGAWVYVVDPNGRGAHRRPIRLGRRNNQQLEVLSGLTAGERVMVSSYALYGQAEHLNIEPQQP
jgi:HlyD family secretion protein